MKVFFKEISQPFIYQKTEEIYQKTEKEERAFLY